MPAARSTLVVAGLVAAVAVCSAAGAQTWTGHAVLIGISDYADDSLDIVGLADEPSMVRSALLADPAHWSDSNITVITDAAATKTAIQSAIAAMGAAAAADDVCLIFYSGHGSQGPDMPPNDEADGLDEYLSTYYTTAGQIISDDELGSWIAAFTCNHVCLVVQSCHAGGMTKSATAGCAAWCAEFAADVVPDPSLARDVTSGGVVALMSSDADAFSYGISSLGLSLFSFYFVESLEQAAADADGDGMLSMQEAHAYLTDPVIEWIPEQVPQYYSNHTGPLEFVAAGSGSMAEPATIKDLPMGGGRLIACGGSGFASCAPACVMILLALLALRRGRGAVALVLVLGLASTGCASREGAVYTSAGGAEDAPLSPARVASLSGWKLLRIPASIGARGGVSIPVAPDFASYDAAPSVGAWLALGDGVMRLEGGIDTAFLRGSRVEITSSLISMRVDAVAYLRREQPVSVIAFGGGRYFVDYVDAYFSSGTYVEEAFGVGVGAGLRWRAGSFDVEARLAYDAILTSTNLGGVVAFTGGIAF